MILAGTIATLMHIMVIPLKKHLNGVSFVIVHHFASSDFEVWLWPC